MNDRTRIETLWLPKAERDAPEDNQDRFLVDRENGIFAIADGMSNPPLGREAALEAIAVIEEQTNERFRPHMPIANGTARKMRSVFMTIDDRITFPERSKHLKDQIIAPNNRPGTTLTLLNLQPEHFAVGWCGDTRLYGVTDEGLTLLTYDHGIGSLPDEDFEMIKSTQSSPGYCLGDHVPGKYERGYRRWLFNTDYEIYPTAKFHRLALISDGGYRSLPELTLAEILTQIRDPRQAIAAIREQWEHPESLRRYFAERGMRPSLTPEDQADDITVILIDTEGDLPDRLPLLRKPYISHGSDYFESAKIGVPTTSDLLTGVHEETSRLQEMRVQVHESDLRAATAEAKLREREAKPEHPDLSRLVTSAINDLVIARLATQPAEVHFTQMIQGIAPTSMVHYNPVQEVYVLANVPSGEPTRAGAALMAADLVAAAVAVRKIVNPDGIGEAIADARRTFQQRFPLLPLQLGVIACTDETVYTYRDEGIAIGMVNRENPEPYGTDVGRVEYIPRNDLRRAFVGTAKGMELLGVDHITDALTKGETSVAVKELGKYVSGTHADRAGVSFFIAPLEPQKPERERRQALEMENADLSAQMIALTIARNTEALQRQEVELVRDGQAEELAAFERRLGEHSATFSSIEAALADRTAENRDLRTALASQGDIATQLASAVAELTGTRKNLAESTQRDTQAQATIDTLARGYHRAYRRAADAQRALHDGGSTLTDLTERLGRTEGDLQTERDRATQLAEQRDAAKQEYATAAEALAAAEKEVRGKDFNVFNLNAQLDALKAELEGRKREGGKLNEDLAGIRAKYAELEHGKGELQTEYNKARDALAEAQECVRTVEGTLAKTQSALGESLEQATGYRTQLRVQRDTLRAVREELAKPSALEEQLTSYRTAVDTLIAKDTEFRERVTRQAKGLRDAVRTQGEQIDAYHSALADINTALGELRTEYAGILQQLAEESAKRTAAEQQLRDMVRINYNLTNDNADLAARVRQSEYVMGAFQTVAGIVRGLITGTPIQPLPGPTAPQGTPTPVAHAPRQFPSPQHGPQTAYTPPSPQTAQPSVTPSTAQTQPYTAAQQPAHGSAGPIEEQMSDPTLPLTPPPYAKGQSIDFATKNIYGLPNPRALGYDTRSPAVLSQYRRELVPLTLDSRRAPEQQEDGTMAIPSALEPTHIEHLNQLLESNDYRAAEPILTQMLGLQLAPEQRPAHPFDTGLQYSSSLSKQGEAVAYNNLGVMLSRRGESEKARACFDMAKGIAQQLEVVPWTIARNARTAERLWQMPRAA